MAETSYPTLHRVFPRTKTQAFGAQWFVDAPWAHPMWRQYLVGVCDLTTALTEPPLLYAEGVTHELVVYAVDPDKLVTSFDAMPQGYLLTPANHVHQFVADSDEAAQARIQRLVTMIEARELSPDTDFVTVWEELFKDGVTLRRGRNVPENGRYQ